jgi:lipoate-protein ligase B
MPRLLHLTDLGCRDFEEVRALQERLVELRRAERIPDTLLFCSHPPVVTAGRATTAAELSAARAALAPAGIPLLPCERGGRLTYHGPGQVILYPLLRLEGAERDLHAFQRGLEETAVTALEELGVAARRRPGHPGVWIGPAKLASVGLAVRGWVTWHGLALNVSGDLSPFDLFHPCGITGLTVTSLERVTGQVTDRRRLQDLLAAAFCHRFRREGRQVGPGELCRQEVAGIQEPLPPPMCHYWWE